MSSLTGNSDSQLLASSCFIQLNINRPSRTAISGLDPESKLFATAYDCNSYRFMHKNLCLYFSFSIKFKLMQYCYNNMLSTIVYQIAVL